MTLRYAHLSQAHKREALKALEANLSHNLVTVTGEIIQKPLKILTGWTGLEPAASCVTGKRSNRAELPPHCHMGGTGFEPVTSAL